MQGRVCPYCKKPSELVTSQRIYGTGDEPMYYCANCSAWVGCHKGTHMALGRLADPVLRSAKINAHKYFDILWKSTFLKRDDAYDLLSAHLELPRDFTHIGMFSVMSCIKTATWAMSIIKEYKHLHQKLNELWETSQIPS